MKTRRLNAVTRILLAIFAMMLIPQSTLAQVDYYMYDGSKFVKTRADSPSALSGSQSTVNDFSLGAGTYYVPSGSPVTYSGCLVINGTVNIILCDGATLNANHGIAVGYDATLNIYGQEKGTGQLIASGYNFNSGGTDYYKGPAIGGYYRQMGNNSATTSQCGKIFIHGGIITASSYSPIGSFDDAAGIGGWGADGASNGPRELTVYGGKVTATGGKYGAGIGGGRNGKGGTVNIYGGEVIATGGDGDRSNNAPARGIGAGVSTGVTAAAPGNGTLTLGSGVTCYGDNTNTDPTGLNPQTTVSTRYQYMKTDYAYNLTVGVTTVKASNASNIKSASTATASFNPITNTLKLNKLSADGPIVSNLANLTIELNDANELTGTQGYIESQNASASLTIRKGTGDGSLHLNNSTGPSAVGGFASVTLEDVYLNASNYCEYNGSNRAYMYPATNSMPASIVQLLDFTTEVYYPLWVGSVQVKGNQLGDVWGSGNNEVSFDPQNNILTLKGVQIDSSNGIETSLPNLIIELDGNNSIITNTGYHFNPIYSSDGTGKLTIKKATNAKYCLLELSTSSNNTQVVKGFGSVEYKDDLLCDITLGNSTTGTLIDADTYGATVYMNFPLWVSGKQVTSANAGDLYKSTNNINKSPTVSFDPDNNILKLNGPTNIWVDGSVPGIKSGLDNLTVYLEYGTSFQINGTPTAAAFEGVNGTENIAFDTDRTSPAGLYVSSGQKDIIKNFNSITYNNGLSLWKRYSSNLGQFDAAIRTAPWAGEGTSSNPFKITNVADLKQIATEINNNSYTLDQHFELTSDIDCGNEGPMASIGILSNNAFQGTFDGDDGNGGNYKIINQTTPYGLFGFISEKCVIKNLTIDNCTVTGTNSGESVAGLVAEIRSSDAEINNCHVINSSISSGDNDNILNAGGIVGYQFSSTVTGCSVENTTITMNQQARTKNQRVGGISGYFYGGTIQNCDVKSSTISSQTSGTNELYTGAIAGELGIPVTLTNNTYDASVQVKTKKGSASEVVRSGNDQRGTGQADANGDFDVFYDSNNNVVNGAVLTGLQTITLTANTDGTIECLEGYYRDVTNTNSTNKTVTVYALPYTTSNQKTKIKAISPLQYDTPTITIPDLKSGDKVNYSATAGTETTGVNAGAVNATWEIEMPAENVTATIVYPIDFSNGNRAFAITNPVNATKVYDGSPISITQITTQIKGDDNTKVTLDISKNEFTITGYNKMSSGVATPLGTTAPTDAGDYQVIISGNGNNSSGTATVNFTITPKSMTDNSIGVSVSGTYAYDGSPKTPTLSVTDGGNAIAAANYTVKYQQNDNGNLTDVTEMRNAGSYKIVVTGKGNYKDDKSIDFTITVMNATPDVQVATTPAIVYDGNEKKPAVTVTVAGVQLTTDDYTVAYSDNINAGTNTAKATVTLKRNYSGSAVKNFTIGQRVVTLDWTNLSFDYDGDEHKPTATVSNKVGSDVCTVTVTGGQTNAGNNYTATATGLSNNNYTLSTATTLTTNFTINPREVTLTWSNTEFTYDGQEHKPMATVTNLVKTDACNVTVTGGQTNAGNYTATASALDNTNYKLPTPNPTTTFTIKDRTANITFNAGQKYKTFYSAGENLLVPDNVKAYVVTSVTGNTVNITQISYIHANAPVLLESSSGATTVKDPNETLPTNLLKYASAGVNTNGKQYVLYSGEFVKATGTIPVGRVYLELPSSSARTLVISTDNTTAIDASFKDDADGEEKWYDMQGRQINKPTKAGLYIKNGQKVVIKNK